MTEGRIESVYDEIDSMEHLLLAVGDSFVQLAEFMEHVGVPSTVSESVTVVSMNIGKAFAARYGELVEQGLISDNEKLTSGGYGEIIDGKVKFN